MVNNKRYWGWNRGRKFGPMPEERKIKIGLANKGKASWSKGLKRGPQTDETKEKIRKANLGQVAWNKGLKLPLQSEETKMRKSISIKKHLPRTAFRKGRILSAEQKENIRQVMLEIMSDPEQIKKRLKRRSKSSLEIKFENIINRLGLPYRFVGNGEVIVARKVPDFVDKDGKKIAIEVFYRKHKQLFKNGVEEWKADRARIFNQNGWQILFFDETQVNEEQIKQKLGGIK